MADSVVPLALPGLGMTLPLPALVSTSAEYACLEAASVAGRAVLR
jgi:hypothetical protein